MTTFRWHELNPDADLEGFSRDQLIDLLRQSLGSRSQGTSSYFDIFEQIGDALIIHDAQTGVIRDVNGSTLQMYGYEHKDELLGETVEMLSAKTQQFSEQVSRKLMENARAGVEQNFDWLCRKKDGMLFWVEVTLRACLIAGQQSVLAEIRDLSTRRAVNERVKSNLKNLEKLETPSASVEFTDLFNLEEIQAIQDLFARANGVASIITKVDGTPLTRPSNFCRLCSGIIRKTEKGRKNCYYSDSMIGRHHPEGPIIQPWRFQPPTSPVRPTCASRGSNRRLRRTGAPQLRFRVPREAGFPAKTPTR